MSEPRMDGKTIEASSRRRTAGQADETQNHDLAPSFLPPLLESGEVMWTWNCRRQSLIPHPRRRQRARWSQVKRQHGIGRKGHVVVRSEEHTSELQSRSDLVCRLLLEKKKTHQPRAGATATPRATEARGRYRAVPPWRRGEPRS